MKKISNKNSFFNNGLRFIYILIFCFFSHSSFANTVLDITRGTDEPLPIAIVDFENGKNISEVVSNNLKNSGLFAPIDSAAFIESDKALGLRPRFADWRLIDARFLVRGKTEIDDEGRMRAEFRLWDVMTEKQLAGQAYFTVPDNWRRIGHLISDEIFKALTGENGYFDTRIVYISESGSPKKRIKKLAIMDQDGANHKLLTDGKYLVLTPRFSPNMQAITYLSYIKEDEPRVYIYNLDTGKQEILGDFPGMTFAPRFSPDGKKVIFSQAIKGANTEIYSMDIQTRKVKRITNNPDIDVSPSYSPDGSRITFNSDRGGKPQLYVMNADGSNPKRISFGKGRYSTPVWSPRGDYIAFTKSMKGEYYIGVMRPDGSDERLLDKGFMVEGPTWAPNGRFLAYEVSHRIKKTDKEANVQIRMVDFSGRNKRIIKTPEDASDPAWSPLIP